MAERRLVGMALEDMSVGQTAELVRSVSEADVVAFAAVSGDCNPVHLDEDYARTTLMKGRVVHGALLGGFISAVLGADMPGPGAIYLSQTLNFKRPVRLDDEVTVRVVVEAIEDENVTFSTACLVRRKVAADGQAVVRVARRKAVQSEAV
ncbi:MAG: MaoC family dehydratase [Caulobacteraceae bacterium]